MSNSGEASSSSILKQSNCNNGETEGNNKKRAYPPGYRFVPTDVELIFYLDNKLSDSRLFRDLIPEVKLYNFSPQKLSEDYEALGEKIWYFFSSRDRKYLNGNRPNRRAGNGYWKATGKEKNIVMNKEIVGFERALVYYVGKPPQGVKSDWIMHEYRRNAPRRAKSSPQDMKLDDCVMCKIYRKVHGASSKKNQKAESPEVLEDGEIVEVEMTENHVLEQHPNLETKKENNYPQIVMSAQDYHNFGTSRDGYITQQQHVPFPQSTFVNTQDRVFMHSSVMMPHQHGGGYGTAAINEDRAWPSPYDNVPNYGKSPLSSLVYMPESMNTHHSQMIHDTSYQLYGGGGFGMQNYHQQMVRNNHHGVQLQHHHHVGGSRVGADTSPSPAFSQVVQSDDLNTTDWVDAQFHDGYEQVNKPQYNGGLCDNNFRDDVQLQPPPSSEEEEKKGLSSGQNSDSSWVSDFSVPMGDDLPRIDDYIVTEDPDNDAGIN